ncbi:MULTISPECIES: type II secretion system protein [unclassified Endozoicomonas]|uniref:type II secretion system protein n=1 Tax=unclassified Endozoicomonas TaxID=2644528 RepID=UPI003BB6A255
MLQSWSKHKGLTLMEVMVALVIFSATAAMLVLTDGNTAKQTRHVRTRLLAAQVAHYYLNSAYAEPWRVVIGQRAEHRQQLGYSWFVVQQVTPTSSPLLSHLPGIGHQCFDVLFRGRGWMGESGSFCRWGSGSN